MVVKIEKSKPVLPPSPELSQALEVVASEIKKSKHKPKLAEHTEEELMADELIQLDNKLRELEVPQIQAKIKTIKDALQLVAKDFPPEQPVSFTGENGTVTLTPCAQGSVVSNPYDLFQMLVSKFGKDVATSVITFNKTALAKVLSGGEIAQYSTDAPGARTCKINSKATS